MCEKWTSQYHKKCISLSQFIACLSLLLNLQNHFSSEFEGIASVFSNILCCWWENIWCQLNSYFFIDGLFFLFEIFLDFLLIVTVLKLHKHKFWAFYFLLSCLEFNSPIQSKDNISVLKMFCPHTLKNYFPLFIISF